MKLMQVFGSKVFVEEIKLEVYACDLVVTNTSSML